DFLVTGSNYNDPNDRTLEANEAAIVSESRCATRMSMPNTRDIASAHCRSTTSGSTAAPMTAAAVIAGTARAPARKLQRPASRASLDHPVEAVTDLKPRVAESGDDSLQR